MGAVDITRVVVAKTAKDAFREAYEEDQDYYGHQEGYSGAFNSTNFVGIKKAPSRYGTKKFNDWVDSQLEDKIDKRDCYAVEITGKAAIDIKKRRGFARTRNKVFLLMAVAPE